MKLRLKRTANTLVVISFVLLLLQVARFSQVSDFVWDFPRLAAEVPPTIRPFASQGAHVVLILSYQRCGSSFFGGLFDRHPQGFYIYEPLDALYAAMYGTSEGWNVPGDIRNLGNGSERLIPTHEVSAVSEYLQNILTCQLEELPSEFLTHYFHKLFGRYQTSLGKFRDCIGKKKIIRRDICYKAIRDKCSRRFGRDTPDIATCSSILWNNTAHRPMDANTSANAEAMPPAFRNYSSCMAQVRRDGQVCERHLLASCYKADFRAVKTVRASMESVEALLRQNPNLRIIHLIRDPRAVVLSRRNFHSSGRSLYGGRDIVKEAKLFCQNLVADIKKRRHLEKLFPGAIMQVLYDEFVQDPVKHAKDIYKFMNVTLSQDVHDWVLKNTIGETNATAIAGKWQSTLTYLDVKNIDAVCQEFFQSVDYDW